MRPSLRDSRKDRVPDLPAVSRQVVRNSERDEQAENGDPDDHYESANGRQCM